MGVNSLIGPVMAQDMLLDERPQETQNGSCACSTFWEKGNLLLPLTNTLTSPKCKKDVWNKEILILETQEGSFEMFTTVGNAGKLDVNCSVLRTSGPQGVLGPPTQGAKGEASANATRDDVVNACKGYIDTLFNSPGLCSEWQ